MKTCTRSSPITETLGFQGKIEAMRYIFDAVTGGYLYHSWKMNTSVAIGTLTISSSLLGQENANPGNIFAFAPFDMLSERERYHDSYSE
ncbi:hypothetical protein D3C71_1000480 [compost metagenome]